MCGIAGGWFPAGVPQGRIDATLAALRHRGPNDQGFEVVARAGGAVAFVHTRLSIIDLSQGGHQPMHTPDGRYAIVYNGEIYNYIELRRELAALGYPFRTDSDTEVLLAAWATWRHDALPRLQGMFAFAVHDTQENTLTCARDAFGIKPLFYDCSGGAFAFASEISALAKLTGSAHAIDQQRAQDYVAFGICGGEARTFVDGVHQLLPGHSLEYDLGRAQVAPARRWWWPEIRERSGLTFAEAADELRERFLSQVRLHLRSDVPLGSALSGGIDSSAIVCAMRRLEPDMPIHTFTFVARGSAKDEEQWADCVNEHVGAVPHKVVVTAEELAADLDDMIRAQGEPFGSTSIYAQYRVYRMARDNDITVTLDGQGADELLAGYSGYPEDRLHSLAEAGGPAAALRFIRGWSARNGGGARRLSAHYFAKLLPQSLRRAIPARVKDRVAGNADAEWPAAGATWKPGIDETGAVGRRLVAKLRHDLMVASIPHLLRYGDRNSMRWSVEARVPFLAPGFAEYLFGLPEDFLVSGRGETKHVFRAAMRGIVPDAVLDRRDKIGFETPEHDWLRALGPRVDRWLEGLALVPAIDARAAREAVAGIIAGERQFSWLAWRLINLSRWAQIHHG